MAKKRPPLSRARVLEFAVELADAHGLQALTMRRLARQAGVEAMSLYHHVANKEQILDGMIDLVYEEIAFPSDELGWREAMRARAVAARRVLRAHPWALALINTRKNPGPATLRHHDALLGRFRAAGFSLEMTGHAVALIDAFVFGFVLQETNIPMGPDEDMAALAEEVMGDTDDDAYPHMTEFVTEYASRPGYSFAAEFDFGLDLVLDGIERAIGTPPASG